MEYWSLGRACRGADIERGEGRGGLTADRYGWFTLLTGLWYWILPGRGMFLVCSRA